MVQLNLRQSKIQHLRLALPIRHSHQEDIRRLDVPMHDAFAMGRPQRIADLYSILDDLVCRQRPRRDSVLYRLPFQQFHHQIWIIVLFANIENRTDIRMIQRRGRTSLLQKAFSHSRNRIVVVQQFDRDFAMQTLVPRPEHQAHTAATQLAQDLVRPEPLANLRNHASDSPSIALSFCYLSKTSLTRVNTLTPSSCRPPESICSSASNGFHTR